MPPAFKRAAKHNFDYIFFVFYIFRAVYNCGRIGQGTSIVIVLAYFSIAYCTRWFKYDQDDLCVNKSQFVPVIFEPPCMLQSSHATSWNMYILLMCVVSGFASNSRYD
jgi:hypothetical protein